MAKKKTSKKAAKKAARQTTKKSAKKAASKKVTKKKVTKKKVTKKNASSPAADASNNTAGEMAGEMVGKKAPGFSLPDQDGKTHKLSDYAGKWVVLYAYPKDDTPGCTKESCGFRDQADEFKKLGAVVLGISILDSKSKKKFADKHGLNFPLLADEDSEVLSQYGIWKEKSMYGKTYMGVSRETFVIDPKGKIAMHWPKAAGNEAHSEEVLAWLKANQ